MYNIVSNFTVLPSIYSLKGILSDLEGKVKRLNEFRKVSSFVDNPVFIVPNYMYTVQYST